MSGGVLVAGVGNLFLGDDGFGPEVARRLAATDLPPGVRVVDYGIRGMHLAYDLLAGYDVLVLLDALPAGDAQGELTVLEVEPGGLGTGVLDGHGMDPAAVLASVEALGGRLPRTVVVGCTAGDVGAGIGLSPRVQDAVDLAVARVRRLVDEVVPAPAARRS